MNREEEEEGGSRKIEREETRKDRDGAITIDRRVRFFLSLQREVSTNTWIS